MSEEEIKEYLKRVDELELKLTDEDKDTYQWLLFGYNKCARLLNEKEQENKQLKAINKEHERLNKENGRCFKITNVQEYNIYELLSYKKYKDNWNKLKEYIRKNIIYDDVGMKILDPSPLEDYIAELEQGSDSDE